MDAQTERLSQEFQEALKAAAEAAVKLQRAQEDFSSTPHYSVIENFAHEAGVGLSRLVQAQQAALVAAEAGRTAACPDCGKICHVTTKTRDVKSIDGDVELAEAKACCSRCERSFFPSAGSARLGQPPPHA
jgi:hypothetical protein